MHSQEFKKVTRNTLQIVAVFTISRLLPWHKTHGITKETVFFYRPIADAFVRIDKNKPYTQYNLAVSGIKFRAYMTWDGTKLGLFPN